MYLQHTVSVLTVQMASRMWENGVSLFQTKAQQKDDYLD